MTVTLSADLVRKIRNDELDISQALLSRAMNIEEQTIFKYEKGERQCRGSSAILLLLLNRRPELLVDLLEIVHGRDLTNEERSHLRKKGGRRVALSRVKVRNGIEIPMDLNYR